MSTVAGTRATHAGTPPGTGLGVADHFRAVAAGSPDVVALTTAERRYTYAEIDRWSDAIAADIVALHGSLDRPVAIITSRNQTLAPAAIAVLKAGHFFTVIDASEPDERIAMLLDDSGAALAIVDSLADAPAAARGLRLAYISGVPAHPFPARPAAAPNPFLYEVYTSGTTGRPKAIRSRQPGWVEKRIEAYRPLLQDSHRVGFVSVPGFIRATYSVLNTLMNGSTLCVFDARNESLSSFAEYLVRERPTFLSIPPAFFRRVVDAVPEQLDFSSVRRLILLGDVVTIGDVEAFRRFFPRGAILQTGYGASEAGEFFRVLIDHDSPLPGPIVPMGRLIEGVEVWLLDEDGQEVPIGEVGELVVRGPDMADGYWNAPELTAEKFIPDPRRPGIVRFHTGDLARRDAEDNYYFLGRKDARLKIHGRRIDPVEVETALVTTGHIREAVVVGKSDELVAYVVTRDKALDARAVRAALREKVPVWMIPSRIYAVDEIPLTRASKIDRKALAERIDPDRETESDAFDDLENRLLAIWSRVLGKTVRLDDDFFDDLGGESLIAAHLVTAVGSEMGRSIPLSLLVELKTARNMANYLRAGVTKEPLAIALQQGTTTPLFVVCAIFGSVMKFRDLAIAMGAEQTVYGLTTHGFDLDDFPKTQHEIVASFADAIREVQPGGPYYLAGYSWGGMTAWLLARHFELAGEKVAFIGVIDSVAPEFGSPIPFWQRLLRFLREPLRSLRVRSQRRADAGILRSQMAVPWIRSIARKTALVRRDESLGRYGGKVTLFRARDGTGRAVKERDMGWRRLTPGEVEVVDIEGTHLSLMGRDLPGLARALARALSKSRDVAAR